MLKPLLEFKAPKVYINPLAQAKIQEYVDQCPTEITWFGMVEKYYDPDDEKSIVGLLIVDVYAPAQTVTDTTTDVDDEGLLQVHKHFKKLKTPGEMLYWGHSHVNMQTNPSGTDNDTLLELIENSKDEFFIMSIHNKNKQSYSALYLGNGFLETTAPLCPYFGEHEVYEEVKDIIKANVKAKTYANTTGSTTTNRGNTYPKTNGNNSKHSGGGSDRKSHSTSASKERNAKCNAVGLRPYLDAQYT